MEHSFEEHTGPLLAGDLIVVEVFGKIVPKLPSDPSPQWFLVLNNQVGKENVGLQPFFNETAKHKAKKYKANWNY